MIRAALPAQTRKHKLDRGLINYRQGMLLRPQHFQLQVHRDEYRLRELSRRLQPYFYGTEELNLSTDALLGGSIAAFEGTILFPDGACAVLGANAILTTRRIPDELLDSGEIVTVHAALRRFSENGNNSRSFDGAPDPECDSRFTTVSGGDTVNDLYGGKASGNVEFMKYNVRIFFGSELENISDFVTVKIAEVYRDGSRIVFNDDYAPPTVDLYTSPSLKGIMSDISALILSKTRVFEKYKRLRSSTKLSSYEIMLMGVISNLCLASGSVQAIQEFKQAHPADVWRELVKIVSLLSAGCDDVSSVAAETRFPSYDHDNLFPVFAKLREQIRLCLNCLSVGPEYSVHFVRGENGIWTATLPDLSKLDSYDAFLAMSGHDVEPDKLSLSFWRQLKLSSAEAMNDLVVRSLPGIPISVADGVHGGLPALDRGFYVNVDRNSELWLDAVENRTLAMLWNAPEDAELVLYVVRNY